MRKLTDCKIMEKCFILLLVCALYLQASSTREDDSIVNEECHSIPDKGNWTYTSKQAANPKPQIKGRPLIVNRLHKSSYGYLGNACVPDYNLTGWDSPTSPNDKWRLVCTAPSKVFVILMSIHMLDGDYLQIRRQELRGTGWKFQGFNFNLNSILIGLVKNESRISEDTSSFRVMYICVNEESRYTMEKDHIEIAKNLFLDRDVLNYLESNEDVLQKIVTYLDNPNEGQFPDDPFISSKI